MHLREVHFDRGLRADAPWPEASLEHLLDRACEAHLRRVAEFLAALRGCFRAGRLAGPGEQIAAAVDDRDALRSQSRYCGCDEVQDRLCRFPIESALSGEG